MADLFQIHAETRNEQGTRVSRRLRRSGKVPAIVYGAGKDTAWMTIEHKDIFNALNHEAFYSHILTLHIDGKPEQVVLKDLLRHPYKRQILHVDFLRVNANEKLVMHVPLHFLGESSSPGIKAGGVVSKLKADVEVRCLPKDLPEYIELDISNMDLDQTYHLFDLKLPKGVELALAHMDEEHNHPVVSIHMPRAVKEEVEAAPAEEIEAAPSETEEEKPGEE